MDKNAIAKRQMESGTVRQVVFSFDNGYGASVINDGYGSHNNLFELAVLHNDELCYDTPITDKVLGWLTQQEVAGLLQQIEALPQETGITMTDSERQACANHFSDVIASAKCVYCKNLIPDCECE